MHNVNRNRANAQEQARRRHSPSWEEESWPQTSGDGATTQSIDLNHATRDQLTEIDGLDEPQARAIIAQRTLYGHFLSWEDVKRRVPDMNDQQLSELQLAARIGSPRITS